MCDVDIKNRLTFIQKQFMCCVPISTIDWLNIFEHFNWELQETLIALTVNLEIILRQPVKISYQKAFLKFIIDRLEKQGTEVHDAVYEAIGRLVALGESPVYFKHYLLDNGKIVSLKESSNIISEGTTGLCTWQASLALSEWCLSHKVDFKSKTILELGSGIGLTGVAVALTCQPKEIYLTDCHNSVLQGLCDNIQTNFNFVGEHKFKDNSELIDILLSETYKPSGTTVKVAHLFWEDITESVCEFINPDILIAADVVYDSTLFSSLINAVSCFLKSSPNTKEFIIACTERNKDTLDEFLTLLGEHHLNHTELDLPLQKNFIWSTLCPVRIFSIRRQQ